MDIWFEGLSLPVSDLDASVAFYGSLGFTVEVGTSQSALHDPRSAATGRATAG